MGRRFTGGRRIGQLLNGMMGDELLLLLLIGVIRIRCGSGHHHGMVGASPVENDGQIVGSQLAGAMFGFDVDKVDQEIEHRFEGGLLEGRVELLLFRVEHGAQQEERKARQEEYVIIICI